MSTLLKIHYAGLDADKHMLDLRAFGEAALGLDKLANTGLIALSDQRVPRKGERFPMRIVAQEPEEGSFEWVVYLAPFTAVALPIVHEMFYTKAAEFLWHWISWVTSMVGGRQKDADPHLQVILEMSKDVHKSHAESEQRTKDFMLEVLDKMKSPAKNFVAPVGESADKVSLIADSTEEPLLLTHQIDVPMADAIRSKDKLEVGDMERMRLRIDGLIHHNRQLKVEHPDQPGKFITANVRDPAFSEEGNVYTDAVAQKGILEVSAKPSRTSDGELKTLYILDASGVVDPDAETGPRDG
ncbi:hypothetical protein ATO10_04887 [Actibacterium atlanticum]|uniref:Uncharacterized protein n=1 Tax=Actibacterium atlanticum TaxID=1461693 RepID=A0A058ZP26_9RHOB|nr:hypothetical protein [Actibacterium atlanticum]KCV82917.1 hypothetical protein ATO10_04887 [Actibacterium atlanticum]